MGSRTIADVAPTAASIAMNAYIFGYGGHSLATPHHTIKRLWWTDDRIEAKVTRSFVLSKLRGQEREFLDHVVGLGENAGVVEGPSELDDNDDDDLGLTNATYMDWILTRAKRLFLILTDVGVPDQIFGCIDDLWDDYDLPIALGDVKNLELTVDGDRSVDQKFYETQFVYLLRELQRGSHIDYNEREHIPIEHVDRMPPAVTVQEYGGRVHFPGRPEEVFMRRKIVLKAKESTETDIDQFKSDVRKAQSLPHPHIAPAWGSYTSGDAGFLLSDFVAEHTLATFLDHRTPPSFMRLSAHDRQLLLWEWMRCLADALVYLHENDEPHTAICPSNIWIDKNNHIAFADLGRLRTLQKAKKIQKTELYDYAAPESPLALAKQAASLRETAQANAGEAPKTKARAAAAGDVSPRAISEGAANTAERRARLSDLSDRRGEPYRSPSDSSSSATPLSPTWSQSNASMRQSYSSQSEQMSARNFSRRLSPPSVCHSPRPARPLSTSESLYAAGLRPQSISSNTYAPFARLAQATCTPAPMMSDIFSLACVYLNIVTFILEGKITEFVRFRSYTLNVFKQRRYRADSSFHSDADLIRSWIDHLQDICRKRLAAETTAAAAPGNLWRGVPEMLQLINAMMSHNAVLRPAATEVRGRIDLILQNECRVYRSMCEPCSRAQDAEKATGSGVEEDHEEREEQARGPMLSGTSEEVSHIQHHALSAAYRASGGQPLGNNTKSEPVPISASSKLQKMQIMERPKLEKGHKKTRNVSGLRSFRSVFNRAPRTVQAV